jgi:FkbM family methyltransferase
MGLQRVSPVIRNLASRAVIRYIRRYPRRRGTWRLLQASAAFLVAELEPGVSIRIAHPKDSMEATIVRGRWREREEAERFLSMMRPGMTVFDVGANLGIYSLMAAKRIAPGGMVHAFEPTPRLVRKVRDNAGLNGFSNIVVNQAAVSDRPGTAQFFLCTDDDQSSLAAVSDSAISVQTITLDDYIAERGIPRVDLMKIDVEGAEVHAFTGSKQLLSGPDAPMIFLEINPAALEKMGSSAEALESLLRGYGYTLNPVAQHEGYRNVLAVPRNRAAATRNL